MYRGPFVGLAGESSVDEVAVSDPGSISQCILGLNEGDDAAVERIWGRYFPRLVGLARQRLAGGPRGVADEEDVALSAFESFCRAARENRFPNLADRDGLWRLLLRMTIRKAIDLRRRERARKRGGTNDERPELAVVEELIGNEPSPEFAAMVAEEFEQRLASLDPELREIAIARFEGDSVAEIAERIPCARRTVERRLQLIRTLWENEP